MGNGIPREASAIRPAWFLLFALGIALSGVPAFAQEADRFHHAHMNVSDIARTSAFYQNYFGVVPVRYNGSVPALQTERAFLFMQERPAGSIVNHQLTGLTHLSWGTVDGNRQYEWLKQQGVEFYTPVSELFPGSTYMYLYGPDREVIEVFDFQPHHRFNHVHLIAEDSDAAAATARFLKDVLALDHDLTPSALSSINLAIDNVAFTIFPFGARFTPRESTGKLLDTDNSHLDHLAFSFRDLDAAYQRITKLGIPVERPLQRDAEYGFRHFFVRAPNGVLIELVEANPWPEAAWETAARGDRP